MDQKRIAVVGLGSMGLGMAASLLRAGHKVTGVDVSAERRAAFAASGGAVATTPREAAQGADILVSVVVNAAQTEAVLFGPDGAVSALAVDGVVISCATVPPAAATAMAAKVEAAGRLYLDAPISGGAAKAQQGALTVMAAGSAAAFSRAEPALDAMATTVYRLGDRAGQGSAVKLINQLLAGVHIAAACEAMTFGIKLGIEPQQLYDVICNAAGSSWMFQNRVPNILAGDYNPKSAVNIFTKDLGIVLDTARAQNFPVPVAGSALQMFLMAAAMGMGGDDDSSVARVYAELADLELPGKAEG